MIIASERGEDGISSSLIVYQISEPESSQGAFSFVVFLTNSQVVVVANCHDQIQFH